MMRAWAPARASDSRGKSPITTMREPHDEEGSRRSYDTTNN